MRPVPPVEDNHAAFDHEQLKRWTDEADPGAAQAVADQWARTGAALVEAAETLRRAVTDSAAGWTGAAAEAMRARLGAVADWSDETGTRVVAASESISRQSEAAEVARRTMPEPVPYDPAQLIRDAGAGGPLALAALPNVLFDQKSRHDAAHEQAVRVVAERDNAMSAAASVVALFRPPPALDESPEPVPTPRAAGTVGMVGVVSRSQEPPFDGSVLGPDTEIGIDIDIDIDADTGTGVRVAPPVIGAPGPG